MTHRSHPPPLGAPFKRLRINIPHIEFPRFPAIEAASRLTEYLRSFVEMTERLQKQMEPMTRMMKALRPRLDWWMKEDAMCKRLELAGWLPHSTSPRIDEDLTEGDVNRTVEAHYRDNWIQIKEAFLDAAQAYEIDSEAKETFREALAAHGASLHRCAARLLFPEIERVSRAEIHAGAMGSTTSQYRLRDAIGKLTPAEIASSGVYGIRLYFKLSRHLYAHFNDTESLARILAEPTVPNRHAAVHGYASYGSFQSSMNSLIIADFLFQAISTIKRLAREDAENCRAA